MARRAMGGPVPEGQDVYHTQSKKRKKASKKSTGAALGMGFPGGLFGGLIQQPANEAGSLAEAIEKQAARLKQSSPGGGVDGGMANPFQMLQDQLFGAVNNIGVSSTPIEQLRQIAEQQVAAQFDPMMSALQREMDTRTKRGNRSMDTARDMYGSLSKDYLSQLPELTEQFAAEDQAVQQRYDGAQNSLRAEYNQNADEQDALLKKLGISAAAPDASQQAREDQAYFQNQFELSQQQDQGAVNDQQNAQMSYQRNLGNTAKMAGENLAQDIGTELADFLNQAGGQMTDLRGQKGAALNALLSQMQMQDSQRVEQQRQQEFDNMMKLFGFQLDATNSMVKNQGAMPGTGFGAEGTLTTGLEGANNYLASKYPDQPIMASNLMEQLNDVLSNKQVAQGKFVIDPGDPAMGKSPKYSDVGQEYMMDLLRREFEKEGDRYGTGDINATMNALLAYLGKLR